MKNILSILLILTFGTLNAQSVVKFKFYDPCADSVLNLNYEIVSVSDSLNIIHVKDSAILKQKGLYIINIYQVHDNYIASYNFTKKLYLQKEYNDTIELPRISIWYGSALHSQDWKFHYCDRLCNGHEIAYYKTGQKWIEGDFVNGIPKKKIRYYDRKGNLVRVDIYNKKGLKRIKYPDYIDYVKNNRAQHGLISNSG
ncbi:MAG: hypothetical protein JXL97_17380 [Bacteroidales bacterium]|nr:hypothetical protein [Bacteroidales bacterium]